MSVTHNNRAELRAGNEPQREVYRGQYSVVSCLVVILTDIWRFVRAIWTVLLPITAPAFGDTGHLVLAYKLPRAAGFGVIVCFGSCKKRREVDVSSPSTTVRDTKHRKQDIWRLKSVCCAVTHSQQGNFHFQAAKIQSRQGKATSRGQPKFTMMFLYQRSRRQKNNSFTSSRPTVVPFSSGLVCCFLSSYGHLTSFHFFPPFITPLRCFLAFTTEALSCLTAQT